MSVNVREDSELIGVGEESGRIQIVDCKKKQPLRKYNTHTKPVHALQFSGRQLLISGSDDKSVQIFDITQDTVIQKFTDASSDYIRSVECLSNTSNILCGSYDGHMTVLDKESGQSVIKFNHGHAIQDIAAFTNGFSLISTGGKEVKLWDIRNNT
jgi:U3 small nucleolar RNA-associated protein 15